jgi:dsDNA-specific endonuclease/ATPase MutS2
MTIQVKELIDKIKNEGVVAAENEANKIIQEAKEKAAEIIKEARRKPNLKKQKLKAKSRSRKPPAGMP